MWATKFKTYSKEDHFQAENTMTPDWWYGIGRFQVRVKRELPMTYSASVSRVRYVCDGACYLNWDFGHRPSTGCGMGRWAKRVNFRAHGVGKCILRCSQGLAMRG